MAGRRPTPTPLKLVKGNPGKRPLNESEPVPIRALPSPPVHMSDEATVAWGRLAKLLDQMGVLTEADGFGLERLAETYAEILRYRSLIEADGETYTTKGTSGDTLIKANPAVAMLADADRRFKSYLVEFGLTPAARTKVKVDGKEQNADPIDSYFG